MSDYSTFVPDVHFEQIQIKNLVSNQEYQRNLSFSHIQRTIKEFNLYQINPVKVSRRDGINYVFNGQHTIEIVAAVSGSRDTPVWCMIYDDMEYTLEADIFANQLKYVKRLSSYEIFMANIEAGNDIELNIKSIVEYYDLIITTNKSPRGICAISALELIYRKFGYQVLNRTIQLCIGTWEGEDNSLSSNMLKGVAYLIVSYGESLRDDLFKDKVGEHSVKKIIRTGKERKGGVLGYSEAMLMIYNKKLKNPLKLSKLYESKKTVLKYGIKTEVETLI